ncbi:unnamed protein product, partial [marine sediment metagenome]
FNGGTPTDIDSYNPATFNGSSSFVEYPTHNVGTTHSIRFVGAITNSAFGVVVGNTSEASAYGMGINNGTDVIAYRPDNATGSVAITWVNDLSKHDIVITRTDKDVNFYVDGSLVGTTQTLSANSELGFNVLGERGGGDSYLLGSIETFEIYNGTLSPQDVADLYSGAYASNYPNPDSLLLTSGEKLGSDLLSGWDFTSGWDVANAGTSINNTNTFTTNATGTGVYKVGDFLDVGTTYRFESYGSISGEVSVYNADPTTLGNRILVGTLGDGVLDFTA